MIKDQDLLLLTRDLPERGLEAGDVGAVVFVHDGGRFEVEFINADGATLEVLTLSEADVRPMAGAETLHVRGLAPSAESFCRWRAAVTRQWFKAGSACHPASTFGDVLPMVSDGSLRAISLRAGASCSISKQGCRCRFAGSAG